jgi:hypothetical protein
MLERQLPFLGESFFTRAGYLVKVPSSKVNN